MRLLVPLLAFGLSLGCGNEVDHPKAAPDCDPATMDCGGYKPPMSGSGGPGGGSGGSGPMAPEGTTVAGDVRVFSDDFFDEGGAFTGLADISATAQTGQRVRGPYDGTSFELEGVLKDPTNWFLVEPEQGSGMLPTITPLNTRSLGSGEVSLGLASSTVVDGMFVLVAAERSTDRAQIVLTVVDAAGDPVPGVVGSLDTEIIAHREAGGWIVGDAETDESGMILFGNVPASPSLTRETLLLTGAVSETVEVLTQAGAITIARAVVTTP